MFVYLSVCNSQFVSPAVAEICTVNLCQMIATSAACLLLLAGFLYLIRKFPQRCSDVLLFFHNLRSSAEILLFIINTLEFLTTLMPLRQNSTTEHEKQRFLIAPPFAITNATLSITLTIILIIYHRLVEIKSKTDYLYLSLVLELLISTIRFYKHINIIQTYKFFEFESFIQGLTTFLLVFLAVTDVVAIYKQRFQTTEQCTSKSSSTKIGYKHSRAPLISKVLFWWMTPLLWRGYNEPLEPEDLGTLLEEDSAKSYYDQFLFLYETDKNKSNSSLWLCYLKSSWKLFTMGGLFKLLGDLSALVGPLSICQIVEYIEQQYANQKEQHQQYLKLDMDQNQYLDQHLEQLQLGKQTELFREMWLWRQQMGNNDTSIIHEGYEASGTAALVVSAMTNSSLPAIISNVKIYYPSWNELLSNGWIIAWLVLISSLAQGGLSQASTHIVNMIGIRIRTSLQGLIYRKTLLLSASYLYRPEKSPQANKIVTHTDTTNFDEKNDKHSSDCSKQEKSKADIKNAGAITNLIAEDTHNVMTFFWIAHYVWAIPLKIGVVMYLLYLKLGISAIIGSLVCIVTMTPLQFLIGKAMSRNSEKAAECTDERLKRSNDTLLGIKLIKLNAWEKVFCDKIREIRNKELNFLNKDSFYWTLMTFLTHVSSVLITFVTLAVFIKLESDNPNTSNINSSSDINNNISTSRRNSTHHGVGVGILNNGTGNFTSHVDGENMEIDDLGRHMEFTASRLFSALALFNQLTVPLFIFPITVPIIISAIVSTKRLQRFFNEPEVQKECVGITNRAPLLCKTDTSSLNIYERNDNHEAAIIDDYNSLAKSIDTERIILSKSLAKRMASECSIKSAPVTLKSIRERQKRKAPEALPENFDILADEEEEHSTQISTDMNTISERAARESNQNSKIEKSRQLIQQSYSYHDQMPEVHSICSTVRKPDSSSSDLQEKDETIVSIRNALFSWDSPNTPQLHIEYLNIPKGKLSVIVGKNGSGKTSLLAALLKEMQQISGDVHWNKCAGSPATVAYVSQTPWLLNATIRDNILFGESHRPKRYDRVLEACALQADLELMPDMDLTVIGERGIKLSGGQKQRIAIARSLYSTKNIVIMDDPLSSLDNEVGKHLFEHGIKKMLLRSRRTVILVTQKLQLVYCSDYIIAMRDGYVQAAGTYSAIETNHPTLITEWNSIIVKGNGIGQVSPGRTARERWKLLKNVSKFALQKVNRQKLDEGQLSLSTDYHGEVKRHPSIYTSRHLTYEMPLPLDECQNEDVIFRTRDITNRASRLCSSLELESQRKPVLRVNSLQTQSENTERIPVIRNISSPISSYGVLTNRYVESKKNRTTSFTKFLNRMSSRQSNTDRTIIGGGSKMPHVIRYNSEDLHNPIKRLVSSSSNNSDYPEDDQSITDEAIEDKFESNEERKYGAISGQIYWLYLKSCGLLMVIVFFLTALVWQLLRVYMDIWLRDWTDHDNRKDIFYYFNMYGLISAVCILMALLSTPAGQIAGARARRVLHDHLLDGVMFKSLHFFQTTPLGRIMTRFSTDINIIDKKIAATSQRLLQFMLLCFCAVFINTSVTPWFMILTIPICIAYYVIQKFYRSSSRELQRIESLTTSPVISHFNETVQGVMTIRAYNQETRFTEILFKRLETNTVSFIILNSSNRWLGIALDYLGGGIVFVAIVTSLAVASINCSHHMVSGVGNQQILEHDGQSLSTSTKPPASPSPSLVGLAINYTLLIPIYLNWVVKLLADMEMYIGAVERVAYYISQDKSLHNQSSSQTKIQNKDNTNNRNIGLRSGVCNEVSTANLVVYKSVPISWPQRGDITFENVSLRYEGQNDIIIKNLYLKIPAGQKIGICGRTGSGKSSLVLSLFQVLDIIEGRIRIDEVDIATIRPDEIRSRLAIIPQDVHLFNGTVRANLDPREHYSDVDLWNSLEMAQLKDTINSLPLGLDSEIIDGGTNFSAGQRQLFCLARAILKGSVCLILDEATSCLDTVTENALLKAATNAFRGRTIITVAHRLHTLMDYDRIIMLQNGQIVDDGTPSELKSKPNGKFQALFHTTKI